jgi:hypothetical protein
MKKERGSRSTIPRLEGYRSWCCIAPGFGAADVVEHAMDLGAATSVEMPARSQDSPTASSEVQPEGG